VIRSRQMLPSSRRLNQTSIILNEEQRLIGVEIAGSQERRLTMGGKELFHRKMLVMKQAQTRFDFRFTLARGDHASGRIFGQTGDEMQETFVPTLVSQADRGEFVCNVAGHG